MRVLRYYRVFTKLSFLIFLNKEIVLVLCMYKNVTSDEKFIIQIR